MTIIPIVIGTRTGGLRYNGTDGDCPNYSIVEISQNTEKSLEDLRRLAVTYTPVGNHQLTWMWKLLRSKNNNKTSSKAAIDVHKAS